MSKAAKHHWYGDTSPWSQQRAEDYTAFNQPEAAEAVQKVVIFDRENPPQPRSDRVAED